MIKHKFQAQFFNRQFSVNKAVGNTNEKCQFGKIY